MTKIWRSVSGCSFTGRSQMWNRQLCLVHSTKLKLSHVHTLKYIAYAFNNRLFSLTVPVMKHSAEMYAFSVQIQTKLKNSCFIIIIFFFAFSSSSFSSAPPGRWNSVSLRVCGRMRGCTTCVGLHI